MDGKPPTPEELAALGVRAQQQQMAANVMKEEYPAFENADVTDLGGQRVLSLMVPLPKKVLVLRFPTEVAQEIGKLLMAPGIVLPAQNGGQPHG
jgi:hypothetical protein